MQGCLYDDKKEKDDDIYGCERHNDCAGVKKIIEGILKVAPQCQMLFNKDSQLMEDDKTLAEYGLTSQSAKAQSPAPIGLALRKDTGEFEVLDVTSYSSPPDLPDVMKSQETNGQEQMDQH